MLKWKAFELHTHTCHSDGRFTPDELLSHAADELYDGIAITDHNTMSAFGDIGRDKRKITVIEGIEWTTFNGHMLVLGAEKYVDWRFYNPDTIDSAVTLIKEYNGVVGVAHPFAMGNPVCTGCRWEFNISWNNVDFIEVWSNGWPLVQLDNAFAFRFWTDLLNKGYRLAATNGRDWHEKDEFAKHYAVTYLGIDGDELNQKEALNALKNGRTYVTAGPQMEFTVIEDNRHAYPGDEVMHGSVLAKLLVMPDHRKEIWGGYGINPEYCIIVANGTEILRTGFDINQEVEVYLPVEKGWIRAELYGNYMGFSDMMLAFTSPVYVI